jgi:hypothetical protein
MTQSDLTLQDYIDILNLLVTGASVRFADVERGAEIKRKLEANIKKLSEK